MTTRSETELATEIRQAVSDFLIPLRTTKVIKSDDFERLHTLGVELLHTYKGNDRVSKSLIYEFYATRGMIDSEIPYHKEKQQLQEMSARLSMIFDLLLIGEVPEDRIPGKPRIR